MKFAYFTFRFIEVYFIFHPILCELPLNMICVTTSLTTERARLDEFKK
jgi:hypothetical protein